MPNRVVSRERSKNIGSCCYLYFIRIYWIDTRMVLFDDWMEIANSVKSYGNGNSNKFFYPFHRQPFINRNWFKNLEIFYCLVFASTYLVIFSIIVPLTWLMHRSASIYYRPNVDSIRSIRTSLYRPNVSCEQREASGLACMSIRMKMSPAIRINVIRHHTTIQLHKLKFTLWFFVECRAGLVIYRSTCLQTNLLRFNRYLSCT